MTSFNKKKEEAQAHLDMAAREKALKQLGIEDRFEFADHAKIYNAEHGRFHSAPIEMLSVPTGCITPQYDEDREQWASDGSDKSYTPEFKALHNQRYNERKCAEDMWRAERHFQRVRADEVARAERQNDGLRMRRAKAVRDAALKPRK